MRAVHLSDTNEAPQLEEVNVDRPQPGAGELLIKVRAAGVIPTELQWYPTLNTRDGQRRIHAIPGHEFSGTIAALGGNAHGFSVGDEVYGMNDWFDQGSHRRILHHALLQRSRPHRENSTQGQTRQDHRRNRS